MRDTFYFYKDLGGNLKAYLLSRITCSGHPMDKFVFHECRQADTPEESKLFGLDGTHAWSQRQQTPPSIALPHAIGSPLAYKGWGTDSSNLLWDAPHILLLQGISKKT